MNIRSILLTVALSTLGASAFAKIPPPPPPADPAAAAAAAAAKAEKDKATAEKGKALQAAAEDRAVKNFQGNMKKAGKPIPKPTPIVVAAAPAPAPAAKGAAPASKGAAPAPAKDAKPAKK